MCKATTTEAKPKRKVNGGKTIAISHLESLALAQPTGWIQSWNGKEVFPWSLLGALEESLLQKSMESDLLFLRKEIGFTREEDLDHNQISQKVMACLPICVEQHCLVFTCSAYSPLNALETVRMSTGAMNQRARLVHHQG